MSLFFGLIGNVLAVGLAARAFVEAGPKGRIAIVVLMGSSFLIPKLAGGAAVAAACFTARIVIAIGCYLYVRYTNAA